MVTRNCHSLYPANTIDCGADWNRYGGLPTYNFRGAHYASKYVAFHPWELIDRNLHLLPTLPAQELSLFNHYVRQPGHPSWHDTVWQTLFNPTGPITSPGHIFPLTDVGGYLETGANTMTAGDLTTDLTNVPPGTTPPAVMPPIPSFTTIQHSLQTGKPARYVHRTLITDANAETNVITALICHADGAKPHAVCARPVISHLQKHIK
jgi:hypothetical protein